MDPKRNSKMPDSPTGLAPSRHGTRCGSQPFFLRPGVLVYRLLLSPPSARGRGAIRRRNDPEVVRRLRRVSGRRSAFTGRATRQGCLEAERSRVAPFMAWCFERSRARRRRLLRVYRVVLRNRPLRCNVPIGVPSGTPRSPWLSWRDCCRSDHTECSLNDLARTWED